MLIVGLNIIWVTMVELYLVTMQDYTYTIVFLDTILALEEVEQYFTKQKMLYWISKIFYDER